MSEKSGVEPACPFCMLTPDHVTASNELAVAFRDKYAVTDGHCLVVPRQHVGTLFDLPPAAQQAVWSLVAEVRASLARDFGVSAFNIGLNDGEAAGQTVDHAHVHVIPRRPGDVQDPRGGIRWLMPAKARYWSD